MIHGYHNNRGWTDVRRDGQKFFKCSNGRLVAIEPENAGSALYLGFELETDDYDDEDDAEYASDRVDDMRGDYCHCEHDGSLNEGFEIITQPMTLAAHKAADWGTLLNEISDRGGHSHDTDTCGLHVHVSRAALGNDQKARDLCVAKILELVERWQRELSCIARRDIACTDWARPTGYGHALTDGSRDARRKAQRIQALQGFGVHNDNRYRAVNLQNAHTVEFRLFRGTLDAVALYATLTLVDGLVRWCKQHTEPETHTVTFDEFVRWVNDETLTRYWARRCSYVPHFRPYAA